MMRYQGSCHCGGIAFEVELTLDTVIDCNCSLCRRRGGLLAFIPAAQFTLQTPAADLATYRFNKKHIAHHFCASCGIAPYGEGADPKGNQIVAINVRCLDGVDLDALTVKKFDGAKL